LISFISLALASDSPPITIPKGFLEQLSTLETFKNEEFDAFIQFVVKQNENKQQTNKNNDTNNLQEGIFDGNE
jgi:hypothetical protein